MNYEQIERAFQTRDVMAPLVPEGMVELSEPTFSARARLAEMGFEYGVVCDTGKVIGFVETAALGDASEDSVGLVEVGRCFYRSLPDDLPSDTTSISELIKILSHSPFQLVARGGEIIGVVTESDLNKHPVYAYFYLLLSGLEQNLFEIIRRWFPTEDHWSGFLKETECKSARTRRQKAVEDGHQLELIYYLFLPQYVGIISNAKEIIREFGFAQIKDWTEFGKRLGKFRNDVMHPIKPLVGAHRTAESLADLERHVRMLTAASRSILLTMDKNSAKPQSLLAV